MVTKPPSPQSDLMRIGTVAEYLKCSKCNIYRLMQRDGLPARRLGRVWVFSVAEVDAWVKSRPGANVNAPVSLVCKAG